MNFDSRLPLTFQKEKETTRRRLERREAFFWRKLQVWTLSPCKPHRTVRGKGSSAFIVGATLIKDAITSAGGMAISASAALPATVSVPIGFANSL
jgi:hypothetical protein